MYLLLTLCNPVDISQLHGSDAAKAIYTVL